MRLITTARANIGHFNADLFEFFQDDEGKLIVHVREVDPSGKVSEVQLEQILMDSLVSMSRTVEIMDRYKSTALRAYAKQESCPCAWHRSRYEKWAQLEYLFFIFITSVAEDSRYGLSVNLSIR